MTWKTEVFVFGSNLKGIHGKGSALHAREKYGAQLGVGVGRTGDAYAIPTKETPYKNLTLDQIRPHVEDFLQYSRIRQNLIFDVVAIGCGNAGFKPEQIAPMFKGAQDHVILPAGWRTMNGEPEDERSYIRLQEKGY